MNRFEEENTGAVHGHGHEHAHEHHHTEYESAQHVEHEPLPCDGQGHTHHHHEDGSCCCHRHEVEFHGINRAMVVRLAVSVVLFLCGRFLPLEERYAAIAMVLAALAAGYDILFEALKNLFKKRFFDEYFLMSVAAIAACVIGEFEEGAAVMVLYRLGETCQDYALRHSRRTIFTLSGSAPSSCGGGAERFITRFSKIYTPVILAMAICVAAGMPLVIKGTAFSDSVYRALTFLVLACPCAIVISVPMAYFAGIGAASKRHIFFSDSTAVDELAKKGMAAAFQDTELAGKSCSVYGENAVIIASGEGTAREAAVRIAKRTRRIAFENIWFVIFIKLTVLTLSLFGTAPLWLAVFADSGVTVLAILNSMRAFGAR